MAHRVWVLVEWVDERNVFPSYGIVNVDLLAYNNTDISVGKVIYISVKYGNPRRAEILRMSGTCSYLFDSLCFIMNIVNICYLVGR